MFLIFCSYNSAVNNLAHRSFCTSPNASIGYISRRIVVSKHICSIYNFDRCCQIMHPRSPATSRLESAFPHSLAIKACYQPSGFLPVCRGKWHLSVALICISLFGARFEQLCKCLRVIYVFFSTNCLFITLEPYFPIRLSFY